MSTRYVLHDSIGSGGMATVHLGHLHAPLGFTRVVAIKRLHPALSRQAEFAAMLVDEARITARVRHLNVIPTLDVFLENGECFLVMEYVEGESLAKLLRSVSQAEQSAPLGVVSAVLCGVLHGLHAAHVAKSGSGVPLQLIHRDVSPQNIIVGSDGIARVFDFGVAKALGRLQQTRAGEFKGKLPYLAPEQFGDGKLDHRVDVYAASVTLWEALTTRRLFDGGSEEEVFGKILQSRIPAPSELRPDVPPALDELVQRGLSRSPNDRFASAAEMALALEQAAPPASPREVTLWLESLAGEALAKRAALVAEIDSGVGGATEATPAPAPVSSEQAASSIVLAMPPAAAAAAAAPAAPAALMPTTQALLPNPAVTQRMTTRLRVGPLEGSPAEAAQVAQGAQAPFDAEAPTVIGLGSSTPPPHSLPVAATGTPRRAPVRGALGAALALGVLAAPIFGWLALGQRQESAHSAVASTPVKLAAARVAAAARHVASAATATATITAKSTSPASSALTQAEPKLMSGAPASPLRRASGATAPQPAAAQSRALATPRAASAIPHAAAKAKPAPKTDYLSSAPFSQRR